MFKMRHLAIFICIAIFSSACSKNHYSHRSAIVSKKNLMVTPVVVDLVIEEGKKISSKSSFKKSAESAKDEAYYKALSENDIDVVIDPIYKVVQKSTLLFIFRKRFIAEVSGLGGKYENPKNIYVVVKKYDLNESSKRNYLLLNSLFYPNIKFNWHELSAETLVKKTPALSSSIKVLNYGPIKEEIVSLKPNSVKFNNHFIYSANIEYSWLNSYNSLFKDGFGVEMNASKLIYKNLTAGASLGFQHFTGQSISNGFYYYQVRPLTIFPILGNMKLNLTRRLSLFSQLGLNLLSNKEDDLNLPTGPRFSYSYGVEKEFFNHFSVRLRHNRITMPIEFNEGISSFSLSASYRF